MEVTLHASDNLETLLAAKLRAEMSFREVSLRYHLVWLECMAQSPGALKQLEEVKSEGTETQIRQPLSGGKVTTEEYLTWLYESLERVVPKFERLLSDLKEAAGVEVICVPLKEKKRVIEKAFYAYGGDYSRIMDIGRGSAIAHDLPQVVETLKWILKHCQIVRLKNRFCDARRAIMARGGYRDVLLNIEVGGFIFELQLHLRPLFAMKEDAHKVLDVARAVMEPTLFKLALLDSQKSHAQLVQKVQQLELQIYGLQSEIIVMGKNHDQQQQQHQGKVTTLEQEIVQLKTTAAERELTLIRDHAKKEQSQLKRIATLESEVTQIKLAHKQKLEALEKEMEHLRKQTEEQTEEKVASRLINRCTYVCMHVCTVV